MPRRRQRVSLLDRQQAFGYTQEDIKFMMAPMAANGEKASARWATTADRWRCCRTRNKPLYNYFKQLFAQVTNPPIDPIREAIVMSLNSFIGPKPNLLDINDSTADAPGGLTAGPGLRGHGAPRHIERHTGGKFKPW